MKKRMKKRKEFRKFVRHLATDMRIAFAKEWKRRIINRIISISKAIYYRIYEKFRVYYIHRNNPLVENIGLVTIITPTYNRPDILKERALKSVLSQTYKNWEWYIVHDGALSIEEHSKYNFTDENHKIFFHMIERNRPHHNYDIEKDWFIGGLNARNWALEHYVKGEFIAALDDDDMWHPEFLEICVKEMNKKRNLDFLSSGHITNGKVDYGMPVRQYFRIKSKKYQNIRLGCHSSFFYRSHFKFMRYNKDCWRKKWNKVEDSDLSHRILRSGMRMEIIDRPLVSITPLPGQKRIGYKGMEERKSNKKIEYFCKKINAINEILKKEDKKRLKK